MTTVTDSKVCFILEINMILWDNGKDVCCNTQLKLTFSVRRQNLILLTL